MPSETFFRLPESKQDRIVQAIKDEVERASYEDFSVGSVIRACGISRMTTMVAEYMDSLVRDLPYTNDSFYTLWDTDQDPGGYPFIRRSNEREAADIPTREAYNAALLVLEEQGALPEESLIREMAKLFGYSRVGDNVNNAMSDGIQYALSNGAAERVNDKIRKV